MPTIQELYRMVTEHEKLEKSASVKQAIASPQRGSGAPAAEVGAVLEDVLGPNIAETKVRIKKKLEEVAGGQKAVEGLASDADDETPATNQGPIVGDKMPPSGEPSGSGVAPAKAAEEKKAPEAEKTADQEKIAAEYYAAGQIMAQGFWDELSKLASAEKK